MIKSGVAEQLGVVKEPGTHVSCVLFLEHPGTQRDILLVHQQVGIGMIWHVLLGVRSRIRQVLWFIDESG